MKKYFLLVLSSTIFVSSALALNPLPRTAYLQYKDNTIEVQTLQQILNSDPDTQVAQSGPGSPGQELSFFGAYTLDAVKRFQQKYNLEVTGKVDYKTRTQLNLVVTQPVQNPPNPPLKGGASTPIANTNNNSDNIYLDNTNTNSNPYFSDSSTIEAQTQTNASPTKTSLTQTLLNAILNKYSSLFGLNNQNTATNPSTLSNNPYLPSSQQTQNPSTQNPFLTPYGNTPTNGGGGASGAAGQSGQGGFMGALNNLLGGGNGNQSQGTQGTQGAQASGAPASQRELDLLNGTPCSPMQSSANATLVGGGAGGACGIGTNFGNNPNGSSDGDDNGSGCTKPGGGTYNTRKGGDGQEGIALPKNIQIGMFGSLRAACGGWVEVTFVPTGKCMTFRIVDTGPSGYTGAIIDLTGVAENKIGGASRQRYCFKKAANQNGPTN